MKTLFILLITFLITCSLSFSQSNIIYVDLIYETDDQVSSKVDPYESVINFSDSKKDRIFRIKMRSMFNFRIYPFRKNIQHQLVMLNPPRMPIYRHHHLKNNPYNIPYLINW